MNDSWSPLHRCLSELEINAPRDSYDAAETFEKALRRWADHHIDPVTGSVLAGPVSTDALQAASDRLLDLVRRDLA